ncbi:MAG: BatD family protein [Mucinivorans sp.]
MKIYVKFLTIISLLLMQGLAWAAPVSFEVNSPEVVAQGERFSVEFTLSNAQGSGFVAPSFTGLDVLAGPTVSSGTQISIINGVQKSSSSQTYTYVVVARQKGKAHVSTASVTAEGKTYSTKALTIEVVADGAASSSTQRQAPSGELASDDILLRMEVNKSSVYKGEAIVATLKLYTRVGIAGLENAKYAAFNGFWAQELTVPRAESVRATVGGKVYESQVIRQWLLYPQKAGQLVIEQTNFTVVAQVATAVSSGSSLFDQFMGGGTTYENVRRQIMAPVVRIAVKELPAPAPAGFAGAVGRFTLQANLSSGSVAANTGGSIILKLSGAGDFPLIETPKIVLPAAFEQYDTKTEDQINNTTLGTSGTRTWEFPFIARAEGEYNIPAVEISYFDTATKSYKTLSSGQFKITITKAASGSQTAGAIVSGVTKEDLKMLGQDIRFIKVGAPEFRSSEGGLLWSWSFFLIFGLEILLFVLVLFLLRKIIASRADVVRTKNKKANKVAIRRLKRAKSFMQQGVKVSFFEEMLRALWGYMGDKLSIDVANLTKERIKTTLTDKGVEQTQIDEFMALMSECEFAQYSPDGAVEMESIYLRALEVIGNMEIK